MASTPELVVRKYLDRMSRRDDSAFDLISVDLVQHAAGPQGRDGLRLTTQVIEHDLGQAALHIEHVVASGDLVLVHLTLTGEHRASTMPLLSGVPATGQQVTWAFMHLWRVQDGLIVEHWACRDDLGLLAQLGAWSPG